MRGNKINPIDIDQILQNWSWIGNYNQAHRMGGVSTKKPIIGLMYISSVSKEKSSIESGQVDLVTGSLL